MVDLIQFGLDILGVFIGAFAAFELDNYRERLNERKEKVRVLKLIRTEVTENSRLLIGIRNTHRNESDPVPYTGLRDSVWNGITSKLDVIANDKLLAVLTNIYYEYDLLERIIGILSQHAMMNNIETRPEATENLKELLIADRNSIIEAITSPHGTAKCGLLDMSKTAIEEIDQEIRKLN